MGLSVLCLVLTAINIKKDPLLLVIPIVMVVFSMICNAIIVFELIYGKHSYNQNEIIWKEQFDC